MATKMKWGSYEFGVGEPGLATTLSPLLNDAGEPIAHVHRYTISGMLMSQGSQPAVSLSTRAEALRVAFLQPGRDFVMTLPDGSRASAFRLLSSSTVGGVRVVEGPNFDMTQPAAGVTFLPFSVTLEAEIPVAGSGLMLMSFEETIAFEETPLEGHIELLNGRAEKQKLRNFRLYRATQSGAAVGYRARPNAAVIAPKIWPLAYISGGSTIRSARKRASGSGQVDYVEFPITWNYQFEANVPLVGSPNNWR